MIIVVIIDIFNNFNLDVSCSRSLKIDYWKYATIDNI